MALTKDEAVSKFRRQWRGMGEEGIGKLHWLLKHAPGDKDILCECYLCQYVMETVGREEIRAKDCIHCPIDWGKGGTCGQTHALYYQWEICNPGPEKAAIAIKISELPEKETT